MVTIEDEIVEEKDFVEGNTVRELVWNIESGPSDEEEEEDEGVSGQPVKSQASTVQQPVKLFATQTYHCCPAGQSPGVRSKAKLILCHPSGSYYCSR